MISGNFPEHLVVGARSGFLTAVKQTAMPWQQIAGQINMASASMEAVDLGAAPMPIEATGSIERSFIEKSLVIKPRSWETTVAISYNALQDDQTGGALLRKAQSAGERFQYHINKLVFAALDAGDGTTYGKCYDGLSFFNDAHIDAGGKNTTTQDNLGALALSLDNFTTILNAARLFKDDQGEYVEHNYDTLIIPPALEYTAAQIAGNREAYDTANREANPYSGRFSVIVSPHMNSTAWVIASTAEIVKPMYVIMREEPALQDYGFDKNGPDGGTYWFKFYARYNVAYGDWRLASMGNS